jgi:serine/threonine protein kinase
MLIFTVEIGSGLKRLEIGKTIHRDLKPKNIFITSEGTYKIGKKKKYEIRNKHIYICICIYVYMYIYIYIYV